MAILGTRDANAFAAQYSHARAGRNRSSHSGAGLVRKPRIRSGTEKHRIWL